MSVSNSADAENIDPAMSAEKQAPGTPSRGEIEAAEAETPPPSMTAEEAEAETPVDDTPEPATTTTPATLDALHNYLGPLCQALLGATPEALRRADASNIEWFAGQPAGPRSCARPTKRARSPTTAAGVEAALRDML